MSDGKASVLAKTFRDACDADETVRARFDADPRGVLGEYGFDIPEGAKCEYIGGDEVVRITMPEGALGDTQLAGVSGGVSGQTAYNAAVGIILLNAGETLVAQGVARASAAMAGGGGGT